MGYGRLDRIAKNIVIATLGPSGTCSEYASLYFIHENNYSGKIVLNNTFEESIDDLKNNKSDAVIIPSAYSRIKEIIFDNLDSIEIKQVFRLKTPDLVIAAKSNCATVKRIATSTHSSPLHLVKDHYPDVNLVFSRSNSESASLLLSDEADACLTTMLCAEKYSLSILYNLGGILMGWNVFMKK